MTGSKAEVKRRTPARRRRALLFVYDFLSLGGVEVVLRDRIRELSRRRIDARALFFRDAGGASLFDGLQDRVAVVAPESAAAWIRRLNPATVSIIDTPAAVALVRTAAPRARVAYEFHSPYPASQAFLLDAELLRAVDLLIVPSRSQRDVALELLPRNARVVVVPNSVSNAYAGSPRPSAPDSVTRPKIGWVGRLDSLKDWRAFVALLRLLRERIDVEGCMVGGYASPEYERKELLEIAEAMRGGLDWRPEVSPAAMPTFYAEIAASGGCIVSTSWAESFGLVVLEAMASGCPVVVPDVTGLKDLVTNGETGFVYPAHDLTTAAEAVERVIVKNRLRERVVAKARALARGYTIERSVDSLLDALAGRGKSGGARANGAMPSRRALRVGLILGAQETARSVRERDATITALQRELTEAVASRDALIASIQGDFAEQVRLRDDTITSMQLELVQKVGERDAAIAALQAELLHKVSARDATIANLQNEMLLTVAARDETIADLQAELLEKVSTRDGTIGALQAELLDNVGQRDRTIAALQAELREKVTARDGTISALQAELLDKVGQRDRTIAALQAELREKVSERDAAIARLQTELSGAVAERGEAILRLEADLAQKVSERDHTIAALQAELHHKVGQHDAAVRDMQDQMAVEVSERDEMIVALRREATEELSRRDTLLAETRQQLLAELAERERAIAMLRAQFAQELAEREASMARLRGELVDETMRRDALILELRDELRDKIAAANELLDSRERELEALRARLQARSDEHDAAMMQAEAVRRRLEERMIELQSRYAEIAAEHDGDRDAIADLRLAIADREQMIERLRQDFARLAVESDERERALTAKLAEIQSSRFWSANQAYLRFVDSIRRLGR